MLITEHSENAKMKVRPEERVENFLLCCVCGGGGGALGKLLGKVVVMVVLMGVGGWKV